MLAKQLTTASRCCPIPKFVGHAGYSTGSILGIPSVTGVGHCWLEGYTRATSLTICRSIGGWTTADSCREDTGTSFIVATMQVHTSQPKRQAEMLTDIMSRSNHASTSTIYIPNLHTDAFTVYTHMHHRHHCRLSASTYMYLSAHTNHNGLMYVTLHVTIDCTHWT